MTTFWQCDGIAGAAEHVTRLVRENEACPACGKTKNGNIPLRESPREISAFDLVNRFKFHPATPTTGPLHELVRELHLELAEKLQGVCPPGREFSTCVTKLEESMMWANAAIARGNEGEKA